MFDMSNFNLNTRIADVNVRQVGFSAVLVAAFALVLGAGKTGRQLRDWIDDVLTGAFGPVIDELLTPFLRAVGLSESSAMLGISVGAISGIGNSVASVLLPEATLADDAVANQTDLMRVAVIIVLAAAGITMALPFARDLADGLSVEGSFTTDQASMATGGVLKIALMYVVLAFFYCLYVRLSLADANGDGKCTEAEYDATFAASSIWNTVFGPMNSVLKLFVAAILPFAAEPAE